VGAGRVGSTASTGVSHGQQGSVPIVAEVDVSTINAHTLGDFIGINITFFVYLFFLYFILDLK
jgi:hypothetical protein